MHQDLIALQCENMSDRELVRAFTLDREDYTDQLREEARRELVRRGIDPAGFLDQVKVGLNGREEETCTIAQARAKLADEAPLWVVRAFTNCLEESLVLQRESRRWIAHHYVDESYEKSFFIETRKEIEELLARFLYLRSWRSFTDRAFDLDRWEVLIASNSGVYIEKITAALDESGVPHTVRTPVFSGDQKGQLTVLVPKEYRAAAGETVSATAREIRALYDRAARLAEGDDREEELEVYDLLAHLVPDHAAVFYNRGSVLFELGRFEEAADSFIEAVSAGLEALASEGKSDARRASGPTGGMGGMIGLVGVLFNRARPANPARKHWRGYPDFIDDAELFLLRILEEVSGKVEILHCLATISRLKNDMAGAAEHYRSILCLEPSDEIARAHLDELRADDEP